MKQKIIFIFDYATGIVYKHYLSTKELKMEADEVFDEICLLNNIYTLDAYYMITSEEEIITI